MSRLMKIRLSVPPQNIPNSLIGDTEMNDYKQSQTVNFLNIFGEFTVVEAAPFEVSYNVAPETSTALLNYTYFTQVDKDTGKVSLEILDYQGWAPIRTADSSVNQGLSITVFKQEVSYDEYGNLKERTIYYPVDTNVTNFHFRDYNVSNHRFYKYVLYPSNKDLPLISVERTVKTEWQGWSITELHPVSNSKKKYSVSSEDVWVFNSNVETGEQQQHIAMNEQQTLGTYPRYSLARQNYIASNVSCLLGDVLPMEYIYRKRKDRARDAQGHFIRDEDGNYTMRTYEDLMKTGGYTEKLPFSQQISSNDKVDMLRAWRKLVHSGNPKLLKDRKGQSFIVAITDSSNKPNDNVAYQPDVISFSWVQIGSTEDVQIVDTSFRGGGT